MSIKYESIMSTNENTDVYLPSLWFMKRLHQQMSVTIPNVITDIMITRLVTRRSSAYKRLHSMNSMDGSSVKEHLVVCVCVHDSFVHLQL